MQTRVNIWRDTPGSSVSDPVWSGSKQSSQCGSQCCGSGMFIPDPGSWFLPIPDPGSRIPDPKTGVKKFFCQTIFCSHTILKTEHYFIFDMLKKIIWPNFKRIIEVFTQKIVTKPSKIWVWDPGSEIGSRIGSRIQGSKRHRIPDPDPQHWRIYMDPDSNWALSLHFKFVHFFTSSIVYLTYMCSIASLRTVPYMSISEKLGGRFYR